MGDVDVARARPELKIHMTQIHIVRSKSDKIR